MPFTNSEPNSGLKDFSDASAGESGWGAPLTANMLRIGRTRPAAVIDRDLTAPPGSPSDGDIYIPAATATGDWAGHEGEIAVYDGSAWVFYEPEPGWLAVILDEDKLCYYKTGGTWSSGADLDP